MELQRLPAEVSFPATMIESPPALPASYPFDPFSLAAYPQDYWARAESRKCFQADKSKVEVNWTEVDSQRRGELMHLCVDQETILRRRRL